MRPCKISVSNNSEAFHKQHRLQVFLKIFGCRKFFDGHGTYYRKKENFLFLYETLLFWLIFSMFHYIMCFKPTQSVSRGLKPSARLGAWKFFSELTTEKTKFFGFFLIKTRIFGYFVRFWLLFWVLSDSNI